MSTHVETNYDRMEGGPAHSQVPSRTIASWGQISERREQAPNMLLRRQQQIGSIRREEPIRIRDFHVQWTHSMEHKEIQSCGSIIYTQ